MIWNGSQTIVFASEAATAAPDDLIAVCVSAYDYDAYILDALESVARQTHHNLELIVVDDASRDATREVTRDWMEAHASRFWRCLCLANRRNQGPSLTRNVAFEHASASHVFVLDADNMIYPRAIEELARVIAEGGFDAAYCQLEMFGLKHLLGHADIFDAINLRDGNYIDVMALISKKAWRHIGGFSHLELGWEDYDFWLKFVDAGFVAGYLPEILCRYRLHGASRSDTEALPSHDTLLHIMAIRHPRARA